jgi:hypothetical protein
MKNAHLRFGWLTYYKRTEKTTTTFKLRLDRFIGEVLPEAPRRGKAHLISVVGGDTQIAAVNAAISMDENFQISKPFTSRWVAMRRRAGHRCNFLIGKSRYAM